MPLSRRTFTAGAGAVTAVAAFGLMYGWQRWWPAEEAAGPADAASLDTSELHTPGPLGDHILGDDNAPVTIVEYASMTCPHCANFHAGTFKQLKERYIDTGRARFIFREFPLDDLALFAAMLARCADASKFYPLIEVLFERQEVWATSQDPVGELFKIARQAGFTEESFNACRQNEDLAREIRATMDRAATEFGVRATPTLFVNGERMESSSISAFEEAIAAAEG